MAISSDHERRTTEDEGRCILNPESDVLAIFSAIQQAMLSNDSQPLLQHVAEDYRGVDAGGRVHDRDLMVRAYGPGGVDLDTLEVSETQTTAWESTVLVSGKAWIRGRYGDIEFEHRLRFLDVYARRDASWQLVASQVTDIADGPEIES
jgi:hypothetical protein